jgi:hypothetical protein
MNNQSFGNVFVGSKTGMLSTTGYGNVFVGDNAGHSTTTGGGNSFFGYFVGSGNTTGTNNCFIGGQAGSSNTIGNNNTAVGDGANVSAMNLSNATAIGSGAIVNASNKIRLGNSSVTVIEGQVAYTFPSDGRFKTNVSENIKGIDFIMRLRPVSYNFQTRKYDDFIRSVDYKPVNSKDLKFASQVDYSESERMIHNGFIAQEVEKAAEETGYKFDGVIKPKNNSEAYGLSYSQFVVPLVKAVQEQQQIIGTQNKKIDQLQQQMDLLMKEIQKLKENR